MQTFTMEELYPLIEEGIKNGGKFRFYPKGKSMLPFIREGEDSVELTAVGEIKKYDVILYRRDNGVYVLHRVVGVNRDGYDLCGDNQFCVEKSIRRDQVLAAVSGIYKGDRYIPSDDREYMRQVKKRVALIPAKRLKNRIASLISRLK